MSVGWIFFLRYSVVDAQRLHTSSLRNSRKFSDMVLIPCLQPYFCRGTVTNPSGVLNVKNILGPFHNFADPSERQAAFRLSSFTRVILMEYSGTSYEQFPFTPKYLCCGLIISILFATLVDGHSPFAVKFLRDKH